MFKLNVPDSETKNKSYAFFIRSSIKEISVVIALKQFT